jgi:hypothetical protein
MSTHRSVPHTNPPPAPSHRCNGGRMLAALSPWDVAGALARTCEAAAAALQQLLTRELAEWRGLALAVRPRCVA